MRARASPTRHREVRPPSYMRVPRNPMASPPLIRCLGPSPIHSLRVVRREPSYMGESDAAQFLVGGMVGKHVHNVWSWSYVLPGRSGGAVWTKKSDTEYTVDGPSYPANGKMVTEHHTCRKVS